MKISDLKPGQILYDVHSFRVGNTTMRSLGVWLVKITEVWINEVCTAIEFKASWNGNTPDRYFTVPSSWKAKKPHIVRGEFGIQRKATREEIKTGELRESADMILVIPRTSADSQFPKGEK